MRRNLIGLLGLTLLLTAVPVTAQDTDSAVCEAAVADAMAAAQANCTGPNIDQVCYGSGEVEALPRYLTADFAFEEPGTILGVDQIEAVISQARNAVNDTYGTAVIDLSAGLPDASVRVVLIGNAFAANNVVPVLELELTTNIATTIYAAPATDAEVVAEVDAEAPLTGIGLVGDGLNITDETWVRVVSEAGDGWVPALDVTEDFLVASLTEVVNPDAPQLAPMQALTVTSGIADRACENIPDSGVLVQTPAESAELRFNGLDVVFNPESAVYVQALPEATLDLYVLEGSITTEDVTITEGTVYRVPVGPNAQVNGPGAEPTAYTIQQVQPLLVTAGLFPRDLAIATGAAVDEAPRTLADLFGRGSGARGTEPEAAPTEAETATEEEDVEVAQVPDSEAAAIPITIVPPEPLTPVPAEPVDPAPQATEDAVAEEADMPDMAEAPDAASVEAGPATSGFANAVRERGTVRIAANGSVPTFSLEEGGEWTGFEIAIGQEVVNRLFGNAVTIEWVQTRSRDRATVLASGEADMMIRNTPFTTERAAWGEWTETFYFVNGQRYIVSADSALNFSEDLAERAVLVQAETPQQVALESAAGELGLVPVPQSGTLLSLLEDLDAGVVDAVSADWLTLESVRQAADDPSAYRLIGDPITLAPWNIAVPPGETAFRDEVDAALLSMVEDGTWQTIYNEWFPDPLPPLLVVVFQPGVAMLDLPELSDEVVSGEVAVAPTPAPAEPVAPEAGEANDDNNNGDDGNNGSDDGNGNDDNNGSDDGNGSDDDSNDDDDDDDDDAPEPTAIPENAPPITGEISVNIFTTPAQQRTMRITPNADGSFIMELIRGGRIVYEARYQFYESSGRYENIRNSFEYMSFSDTAGDTSLGCNRDPDIEGFFNGAAFQARVGC